MESGLQTGVESQSQIAVGWGPGQIVWEWESGIAVRRIGRVAVLVLEGG